MDTSITVTGRLLIREVPTDLVEPHNFLRWWLSRMSEREKNRYTVWEGTNLLTTAGRNTILTFIGSSTTVTQIFAQQFAVGIGAIANVTPNDTQLAGELFRAAPASYTVAGTTVTISTPFGAAAAVGTYTNAGMLGNGATSTPGSGTLMTHLLCSYSKPNGTAIINDYVITLA